MASVLDEVVGGGYIKAGRLFIRDRRDFDRSIAKLRDGWEVEIAVRRRRAVRSPEQNRYLWGVVYEILAHHTGYTPEEIHEFCKAKFTPKKLAICDSNGVVVDEYVLGASTRLLTTEQFMEYVDRIKQWASETLDLYIPDPNEYEAVR